MLISKEKLEQIYSQDYQEKLEKETENVKKILDDKYKAEIEDLKHQLNQKVAQIDQQNSKISSLKEKVRDQISQISEFEEEQKNRDVKNESLKEEIESGIKCFFELYHTKTRYRIIFEYI